MEQALKGESNEKEGPPAVLSSHWPVETVAPPLVKGVRHGR